MEQERVHFTIDNYAVDVADWRMGSIANGGYDTFRGVIRADVLRQRSSISQGAVVKAFTDSGVQVWEGRLTVDPVIRDGLADLSAVGYKVMVEKRTAPLFYQSRDTRLWTPREASPFQEANAANVNAQVHDGGFEFSVDKADTVGGESYVKVKIEGGLIRRFRATVTPRGWHVNDRFLGPNISSTGGEVDSGVLASPTDTIQVGFDASAETRVQAATCWVTNVRINGLLTTDSAEVSAVAADVGTRAGYDASGIPVGPGVDSRLSSYVARVPITRPIYGAAYPGQQDTKLAPWEIIGTEVVGYREALATVSEPAVVTSALNVLPLHWTQGSWADLLDYLGTCLDWRWRVLGNQGAGPLLQFGPWVHIWNVTPDVNVRSSLTPQERYTQVTVTWRNDAGQPGSFTLEADPHPFPGHRDVVNDFAIPLPNNQSDTNLVEAVATNALERLTQTRLAGSLRVIGARDAAGPRSVYEILAGDMIAFEGRILRISQVELDPEGATLGIEAPSAGFAGRVALDEKRRARTRAGPFGVIN